MILKTIFRLAKSNKINTAIGVAGLALGLSCVLAITIWVLDELSMDQFHEKIDNIAIVHAYTDEGGRYDFSGAPPAVAPAVAPALKEEFPGVIESARYISARDKTTLSVDDTYLLEDVALGDFSLFSIM